MEELLASAYLAGANTRRVKKALFALFKGAVSKDVVSRTWGKVKGDCQAWRHRSLAEEDIVYLLLDGMVVKTRLDKKATAISVPVALGVRDGQKVLLAVQPMAGESTAAWRRKCRAVTDSLQEAGERLFSCIGVYRPCGKRYAPPPPSNNSTGNSAAASKPGPFSPVPIPCPCSSGHCWHQDRSRWARWMVGHIWHTPSSLHP